MSTLISSIYKNIDSDSEKIIVYDSKRSWTWIELLNRAKFYSELILKYNNDQNIIPILVDRSGESISAILGCILLKKGIAPLSSNQPSVRIEKSLNKLNSNILLSPFNSELNLIDIKILTPRLSSVVPKINYDKIDFNSNDILYNLFTSGSTGDPKGVMVSSDNIENTIKWSQDIIDWRDYDIIGCATNLFFDISMFDMFTTFYLNIPLAIYSEPNNIIKVIDETEKFKITSIFSVPLFFTQFLKYDIKNNQGKFKNLRRILSGGDFFHPNHILEWMRVLPTVNIYNVWGPTETSIVNTMHLITQKDKDILLKGESPSVGKAHPKMDFVLVNDMRNKIISKIFNRGEIAMLGKCVTQGYLKDKELTLKSYGDIKGERCFYTNDIGYLDNDGNLFIQGRKDSTVKISGYRVDLCEIEFASTNYNNIQLAVVFVKKINELIEELRVVLELKDNNTKLNIFNFKQYLRKNIPQYMIPKRVFLIDKMYLSPNGKIDRKKVISQFENNE